MADGEPDVTVVNVDTGNGSEGATEPVVVPVAASDPWPTVNAHTERIVALEGALEATNRRLDEVAGQAGMAAAIAEGAAENASDAVGIAIEAATSVDELAEEAEEAVAAVAEEADADTADVREEVEEIAPNREHPWFRRRSIMKAD